MGLDLDAIKARCEAATPGLWHRDTAKWDEHDQESPELVTVGWSMRDQGHEVHWRDDPIGNNIALCPPRRDAHFQPGQEAKDATFIAHAREDLPALITEVERLRTACAELAALHSPGVVRDNLLALAEGGG